MGLEPIFNYSATLVTVVPSVCVIKNKSHFTLDSFSVDVREASDCGSLMGECPRPGLEHWLLA